MQRRTNHRRRGFTLIEIMVVVIVLGILAAVVVPNIAGRTDEARVAKARSDISSIQAVIEQFRLDMRRPRNRRRPAACSRANRVSSRSLPQRHEPFRVDAYQLPSSVRGVTVDRKLVDAVHEAGSHIHLWTVNDPDDMRRFLDLGVDGIVTDRPDLLNDVLEETNDDKADHEHG